MRLISRLLLLLLLPRDAHMFVPHFSSTVASPSLTMIAHASRSWLSYTMLMIDAKAVYICALPPSQSVSLFVPCLMSLHSSLPRHLRLAIGIRLHYDPLSHRRLHSLSLSLSLSK